MVVLVMATGVLRTPVSDRTLRVRSNKFFQKKKEDKKKTNLSSGCPEILSRGQILMKFVHGRDKLLQSVDTEHQHSTTLPR